MAWLDRWVGNNGKYLKGGQHRVGCNKWWWNAGIQSPGENAKGMLLIQQPTTAGTDKGK